MQKPFILSVEIPGPFNILSHQTWLKPTGRKPPATGEAIAIQAVQASSSNTDADASNLINRSGLRDRDIDGLNEHSGDTRHMWLSAKGQTQGWLEFDLGEVQEVGTICIWNFNDTWRTDRGLRQADLSIWTAEGGWQKVRDDLLLEQAEGGDDYDEPVVVKLDPVKAQKIRLDDFATFGDAEVAGLSEVQFFKPPGPAVTKLYPSDGDVGAGVRDLELTWVAGRGAKAHNVYLGTTPDDLKLLGKVEHVGVRVSQLKCNTRYYWRVDEVQADGSVAGGKVCAFTTGGLAAWWKLDESEGREVADHSGNHRQGVIHGDPVWKPAGGRIGGALQFDGVDDYVDTGWAENLPTWTVSLWVTSPAAPRGTPVPSGPVHRQANLQINWNHHTSDHRGDAGLRVGAAWQHASFGSLDANTWYHLVATFDGRSLKAYKDGNLVSENPGASGRPTSERATLKIGRHATDEGYFAGSVDDLRIFTYALSAGEVKALYSGRELTATEAGPALVAAPGLVSQR